MIYEVDKEYSRDAVIARPGEGFAALGAFWYPQGVKDLESPRREMNVGPKARIYSVPKKDVDGVETGVSSAMDKHIRPIAEQVGAYAVERVCHLLLSENGPGLNVFKTLFELTQEEIDALVQVSTRT